MTGRQALQLKPRTNATTTFARNIPFYAWTAGMPSFYPCASARVKAKRLEPTRVVHWLVSVHDLVNAFVYFRSPRPAYFICSTEADDALDQDIL